MGSFLALHPNTSAAAFHFNRRIGWATRRFADGDGILKQVAPLARTWTVPYQLGQVGSPKPRRRWRLWA